MTQTWDEGFGPPDPVTEDSVARAFAEQQAGQLRYCGERGGWYVFDGAVWRRDRTGIVIQRAREMAREVGTGEEGEARHGSQTMRFVAGVERFARVDPAFSITADAFDADPFLLGTPGGPVDLRNGKMRAAAPGQNLTRATAVGPAATAECTLWRRFLAETFGDPALVRFLRQFLGTALTGDTREQVLVFGHGTGGAGKSVLARTIAGLMGDYAAATLPGVFTSKAAARHPGEIARLDGVRLVTMEEADAASVWDAARLKRLTGGDPLSVRVWRADPIIFTPRFKLLVLGDQRPALARVDESVRRRLCLLPFAHRPDVPDRGLADRLRAEWPGILRWMIEGCLDWQAHGLVVPAGVREATADYLGGEDVLGQFLDAACDCAPGDAACTAPSGALFDAWSLFAREAGEAAGSQRSFAEALQARGFARGRTFAGRHFAGLRLRATREGGRMTA